MTHLICSCKIQDHQEKIIDVYLPLMEIPLFLKLNPFCQICITKTFEQEFK